MIKRIATIVSWLFSPYLIPTYAALLILFTGFHYSALAWPLKRIVLAVILFSTALVPFLVQFLYSRKYVLKFLGKDYSGASIMLIYCAISYYLGYFVLSMLPQFAIFKLSMMVSVLLIIALLLISLNWNISIPLAALGALLGLIVALSIRMSVSPVFLIAAIVMITGSVASARLILVKNTHTELLAGFLVGFLFQFLSVYFL